MNIFKQRNMNQISPLHLNLLLSIIFLSYFLDGQEICLVDILHSRVQDLQQYFHQYLLLFLAFLPSDLVLILIDSHGLQNFSLSYLLHEVVQFCSIIDQFKLGQLHIQPSFDWSTLIKITFILQYFWNQAFRPNELFSVKKWDR